MHNATSTTPCALRAVSIPTASCSRRHRNHRPQVLHRKLSEQGRQHQAKVLRQKMATTKLTTLSKGATSKMFPPGRRRASIRSAWRSRSWSSRSTLRRGDPTSTPLTPMSTLRVSSIGISDFDIKKENSYIKHIHIDILTTSDHNCELNMNIHFIHFFLDFDIYINLGSCWSLLFFCIQLNISFNISMAFIIIINNIERITPIIDKLNDNFIEYILFTQNLQDNILNIILGNVDIHIESNNVLQRIIGNNIANSGLHKRGVC